MQWIGKQVRDRAADPLTLLWTTRVLQYRLSFQSFFPLMHGCRHPSTMFSAGFRRWTWHLNMKKRTAQISSAGGWTPNSACLTCWRCCDLAESSRECTGRLGSQSRSQTHSASWPTCAKSLWSRGTSCCKVSPLQDNNNNSNNNYYYYYWNNKTFDMLFVAVATILRENRLGGVRRWLHHGEVHLSLFQPMNVVEETMQVSTINRIWIHFERYLERGQSQREQPRQPIDPGENNFLWDGYSVVEYVSFRESTCIDQD